MHKLQNFSLYHSIAHSPMITSSLAVMVSFLVRKRFQLEGLLQNKIKNHFFASISFRTTLGLYSKFYLLGKAALFTYYLVVPFRCSYIGYLIKYEDAVSVVTHASLDPVFSHYSIVLGIFRDPFSANAFGALGIYAFYVDYVVFFGKFFSIGGHFFRLLDRLFETKAAGNGKNDEGDYFFEREIIQRTIHFARLQNTPVKVALFGLVLIWSILSAFFLRLLYYSLPSMGIFLLACLDHGLMFYGSVNSIRMGLFFVEILLLLTVGTRAQMVSLNRGISRRLAKEALYKRVFPGKGNSHGLICAFEAYQSAHWRLFTFARHLNGAFVSQFLAVTIGCNILINVLAIALIVHDQLTPGEQVLFEVLITIQTALIGGACLIFIRYADALHWPARVVVNLQMAIEQRIQRKKLVVDHCRVLKIKLRLLTYYELVHRRNRFYFTIGSMAKITSRTIYKFFYAYSAFLMFIFGLVRTVRSQQE